MNIEPESREERLGRMLVERDTGARLSKVPPVGAGPHPDHRSVDGPECSVEVKRITSDRHHQMAAASHRHQHVHEDPTLTRHWWAMVEAPSLSSLIPPIPDFAQDNPELATELRAAGMQVIPRAEREAHWLAEHPVEPTQQSPRLKSLPTDLVAHLAVLEGHGVFNSSDYRAEPAALRSAFRAAQSLVGRGGSLYSSEIAPGSVGSVEVVVGTGYVRTGRADTVVQRAARWLDESEQSKNLRSSLRHEIGVRHAVLVFDASTEPEVITAEEAGPRGFVATLPIHLPAEIDVLWLVVGSVALRCDRSSGWRSVSVPAQA